MGVELMKEHVGIAMRGCHRLASRHPLLAFMTLVLIWIYRSFPSLFALLVDASPVIASTTVLLGILLFLGHSNAPEIQKEGKTNHHKIHNLKFGVVGDTGSDWRGERPERRGKTSRKRTSVVHRVNVNDNHHIVETDKLGRSSDKKLIEEAKSGVGNQNEKIVLVNHCAPGGHRNEDDKGWETGSELAESTSPTASMADIFPMHDELPEVPQHAHISNLSTDVESCNSEENDLQGDIQGKDDEEKKEEEEEDQKNLMNPSDLHCRSNEKIIESAPSVSMARRSPSDLSNDTSRQENVPVDSSVPFTPNNQFSHHHESFEVGPSTIMASKQGYNSGQQFVPEPETPDAKNYSSMHREMDECSDSNRSSTPDHTESVGFPLTEDDPSRKADSTSIKEGVYTESVASSHYEDDPSREADLISVKEGHDEDDSTSIKKGDYSESVASSHYKDDPSREADLISVKEGYDEDDSTSIKKGIYPESVASSHYEDDPSREADLISVKEGYDEDDSTSIKKGIYPESVASSHYEDDPSREADLISVKEGYDEDDSTSIKKGIYPESVASSHYEDDPSPEDDLISIKEGYDEDDSTSIKKGFYAESVGSSHYEDDPSQEADSTSVKQGFYSQSIGSSHYEEDHSREADLISVKEGYYEDDSTSVKDGYYAESVASYYTEDDPSQDVDTNSVKEGYYASEISDYVSQRSGSSDDNDTVKLHHDGKPDEIKTNGGGETGYQGKSRSEASSSPFSDMNEHVDDDEEEYQSTIMPLTSNPKEIQEQGKGNSLNINSASTTKAVDSRVHDSESDPAHKQDDQSPKSEHDDSDSSVHDSESESTVSKPNEGRFPQRLSQVQQGLTSWFKWKA